MIILASSNENKIIEIAKVLQKEILPAKRVGYNMDIPETGQTLEENALIKARAVHAATGENTLADDSGLEVEALNGAPGVYSARYAGEPKDDRLNIQKLLKELEGSENRRARFRTVLALIWNGEELLFEGTVEGSIAIAPLGTGGFGYDPVFVPEGEERTFAQMTLEEKNKISHRGKALQNLAAFLNRHG